jgi:RNA polymerase sigma factor (sigma-70 family)
MIDSSLINACINNEAVAQRELYNRYSGVLFGICYRYACCKEDAEDMMQEAFVKIFNGIQRFENKGNFEGWMKKIVVNTCINYLVKHKKFADHINIDNVYNIEYKEESVASKLLGKQVMECLRAMPIGFRTVINLHAIEGYHYKEIAAMLNVEESTCRSQYIRGKQILELILMKKKLIPKTQETIEWLALLNG